MTLPAQNASVIGIDIGGTKTLGGSLRFPGGTRGRTRIFPTSPSRGGRPVLEDVLKLARELAGEARQAGAPIAALGVDICELVDRNGHLASANAIPWLDLPVRQELSTIAPVVFEADVRAAALAESSFGAGRRFRHFLYLSIGTGISCCLMLEGQPYLGARGLSGTIASSPLAVPCEHCGQTNRLTLEELASGPGLVARFQAVGGTATTGQQVVAAAGKGNRLAKQVLTSARLALASQLGLLVNTLDPEAVILGGGLGLSEAAYGQDFIASIRKHIWSTLHRELPILRAETGTDAGWIGAALSAARKLQLNTP